MNRLHYSPGALSDLDETWTYISDDLQCPAAARETVDGILACIEKLQEFPEIGAALSSITDIQSDYRFLVCGNYLAFYRIQGAAVHIARVLHGRRDYLRILFGDPSEDAPG